MELNSPAFTRLPYEIFRQIIVHTYKYIPRALEIDDVELDLQLVSPPIIASHVCRSWRYDLLSDPSMWSLLVIPQIKPSGILELLRRADSTLLNVILVLRSHVKVDYDDTSSMLFSLFSQIRRFNLLHVEVNVDTWGSPSNSPDRIQELVQQVLPSLRQPAPELQTFHFWYTNHDHHLEDTFLDTLFSKDAPKLKRLRHKLSNNFRELSCPLFRDLSELYLTLPYSLSLDFGRFLDLLALSPCLKLFSLYAAWDWLIGPSSNPPISDHTINLPHLKRLALEVNTAVVLLPMILERVVLPSDFNWHFDLQYRPDCAANSPLLSQLLFEAHFTFLHITFTDADFVYVSFQESRDRQYINRFNGNKLIYSHEDTAQLLSLWDPLMQSISASSITCLDIEVEGTLEHTVLPTIFASSPNLTFLSIKQKYSIGFDDVEPCVMCLTALTPSLNQALDYDTNHMQDSELDLPQDSEGIPFNPNPLTISITPELPCPLLRELTVELSECQFNNTHASLVRACYDRRQEAGYPLQISIRCPKMENGVESVLQLNDRSAILVSIVPRYASGY